MKLTPKEAATVLNSRGIKFISGKWFNSNEEEIYHFEKYIYSISDIELGIDDSNDVKRIIDTFIQMYGTDKPWPEMPIIKEARKLTETHDPVYPLTRKQLILIRLLIEGYHEYMYILCGIGGSGKSTFANIVSQIFEDDVAGLTLADLSNPFMLARGVNSRLIYADELNSDDIDNGVIKTLVSKQRITVNPKNQSPFDVKFQGNLFFSCNRPPRFDLSDSGMMRRVIYLFMNEKIKKPNPSFQKERYSREELVNIVKLALELDMTDWEREFRLDTHELLKSNSSVFICSKPNKLGGLQGTAYVDYCNIAREKGMKVMSEPKWSGIMQVLLEWEEEEKEDIRLYDKEMPWN